MDAVKVSIIYAKSNNSDLANCFTWARKDVLQFP